MSRIAEAAFGDRPYPESPGYKEGTTSRDAARAISLESAVLREKVFAEFVKAGFAGLTADEVADRLKLSVLSVRPRVSELAKAKPHARIIATDQRRRNKSRMTARVWRIT